MKFMKGPVFDNPEYFLQLFTKGASGKDSVKKDSSAGTEKAAAGCFLSICIIY